MKMQQTNLVGLTVGAVTTAAAAAVYYAATRPEPLVPPVDFKDQAIVQEVRIIRFHYTDMNPANIHVATSPASFKMTQIEQDATDQILFYVTVFFTLY